MLLKSKLSLELLLYNKYLLYSNSKFLFSLKILINSVLSQLESCYFYIFIRFFINFYNLNGLMMLKSCLGYIKFRIRIFLLIVINILSKTQILNKNAYLFFFFSLFSLLLWQWVGIWAFVFYDDDTHSLILEFKFH